MCPKKEAKKDEDRCRAPDAVHHSRFEVNEDCSWDKLASLEIEFGKMIKYLMELLNEVNK